MDIKEYEGMTAIEKLNYFRNCHYTDGNNTELGIIADAINEIMPHYMRIWRESVTNCDSRIEAIIAKVREVVAKKCNNKSLQYYNNIVQYGIAQVYCEEDEINGVVSLLRIEFWNETGAYNDKVIANEGWICYIPEIGSGEKRKVIAEYDEWQGLMELEV